MSAREAYSEGVEFHVPTVNLREEIGDKSESVPGIPDKLPVGGTAAVINKRRGPGASSVIYAPRVNSVETSGKCPPRLDHAQGRSTG